ncbi:amino acid ABC transporter permease [Leucobacter celer]|uniref:amino acid ABC transporter permease n=1 Tax=Leucobacter celer TaxID=668625 RepID=UPI0009499D76|nr:amino acid ABC transporter permease [Leucobacter celer]
MSERIAMSSIADTPTQVQSTLNSLEIQPRKRWLPILGAAVVLFVVVAALWDVATNERFRWPVVLEYLFNPQIIAGVGLTLVLTVVSMAIGIVLGIVLAIMRLAKNPTFSLVARGYIWFFRGTPLLVQLIFWYNIAALYPVIALGLPFGGPSVPIGEANVLITPLTAALLGLALNEAAYMAEIIRSGIQSVDEGQRDAGRAIGMTNAKLMWRVVLPQAMRIVIPPTGNQVISMLKGTSLVSVLAISDLLYSAQIIYALNYQTIPLLLVACVWYLAMTSALTAVQGRLEARYGRGFQPRSAKSARRAERSARSADAASTGEISAGAPAVTKELS